MAGDEAVVAPRKGGTGTTAAQAPAAAPAGEPQQAGLRCPRCDSPNTKFCYYNNYSLSQPRHFCKTCRRYWTKGGALRNVPVGGGCRKNKRSRSSASSAASSRLSLNLPGPDQQHQQQQADQQQAAAVRMGGGFHGVVDFHPGISMLPGPGGLQLHSSSPTSAVVSHGQYGQFGEWPAPGDVNNNNISGGAGHGMSGGGGSIASSIESLSYINQDLHWKLQQQRVATMFLGPPVAADAQAHHHHHQFGAGAAAFLQMETTTAVPAAATSWFMDSSSSYAPAPLQPNSSSSPCRPHAAASCSNINSGRSSGGGGGGDVDNATSNNNNCGGSDNIPSWGDISTFAMLP